MLTPLISLVASLCHLGGEKPMADTIRLLPNAIVVYNGDTLQSGKTSFQKFQEIFSVDKDSLPELQRSTWDGTSVNFSTGESKGIGGMEYIQKLSYKELQLVFKSSTSRDKLILESITFAPKSPCDREDNKTVLFWGTDNISSGKPHKILNRFLADNQNSTRVRSGNNLYYTFARHGFIVHLLKCGNSYSVEQVIARQQQQIVLAEKDR